MTEKLLVPDIGDFENVEVIELLVKKGQEIKKNDPVVTIESDKSSVEIPSIFSGTVESIAVKVGDKDYTLKDAIEIAGLQLEEFFSEEEMEVPEEAQAEAEAINTELDRIKTLANIA